MATLRFVEQLVGNVKPFTVYNDEAITHAKKIFPNAKFAKPEKYADMFGHDARICVYRMFPSCAKIGASKLRVIKMPLIQIFNQQKTVERRYHHDVDDSMYPLLTVLTDDPTANSFLFYALAVPEQTFIDLFYPRPDSRRISSEMFPRCRFCMFSKTCPISLYEDKSSDDRYCGNHHAVLDFLSGAMDVRRLLEHWQQ